MLTAIKMIINRGWTYIRESNIRLCIVQIVLAFLAARLFIYTGYVRYSPEREAQAFVMKLLNADYDSIYDDLDLSGDVDDFLSKEAFVKAQQSMHTQNYIDFQVEEPSTKDGFVQDFFVGKANANRSRGSDYVPINFTDQEGNTSNGGIQMHLNSSKKFFLFQNWKPDLSDYIIKDFMIYVPKGAAVTLGGVNLSADYLQEENGSAKYVIPQIFKGYYELKVTKENMEDLTMTVNTANGSCSANTMKLKPEVMQKAVSQAAEDLKKIYKAVFEYKDASALKGISILPESANEVQDCYLYLAERIWAGKKLSLVVGEIQPEASCYNDDGRVTIYVNLNYDYSGLYEETYWDEVTNQSYNGNNDAEFVYLLDDSKLQLTSFSNLELY